jgi:hypothetical protein
MLRTPFCALGLLFFLIPKALAFKHSNGNSHGGHQHKRGARFHVSIKPNSEYPTWKLTDSFQGKEFYDGFDFKAVPDFVRGRVK